MSEIELQTKRVGYKLYSSKVEKQLELGLDASTPVVIICLQGTTLQLDHGKYNTLIKFM